MPDPLTILSIFAHPDDEIGVGSTLACYSDKGVHNVLVCATRGEAATIFCEDCATRETLPQVRTRELECACAHLGIAELRWLDWPDGKVKDLPRAEAIRQIVQIIRQIRPDVILTHPENGLYPHPDHLAIWQIVRAAFDAAADADEYPEEGAPWAASRLFTRALPQSIFERAPSLMEFRVELDGQLLPFLGVPDEQIDVWMHVAPWIERRMAAWNCHRSQHNPRGFMTTMPDGLRREMAENEPFLLVAARIPLPEGVNDDLLAGLARERPQPAPTSEHLAALQAMLALQRALADVCATYLGSTPEPKLASLLHGVVDGAQQMIYRLARALRIAGVAPGTIERNESVYDQGVRQESEAGRLAFLRATSERGFAQCRDQAVSVSDPSQREVWEELSRIAEAQKTALEVFVA